MVSKLSHPAIVGFPVQNYCYKSVAMRIPHDLDKNFLTEFGGRASEEQAAEVYSASFAAGSLTWIRSRHRQRIKIGSDKQFMGVSRMVEYN